MDREALQTLTKPQLVEAFGRLLDGYMTPSFGAMPKREIDLVVLEALVAIRYVSDTPTTYELISKLKVTRARARSLIYERELRRLKNSELDSLVIDAVTKAKTHKDGDLFVLEVENPYALDHLKYLVQKRGYAADGSFSASVVRLSLGAFSGLIEELLDENQKKVVKSALVAAGAPDKSLKGVLMGALKKAGSKVASEAGEEFAGELGGYVASLVSGGAKAIAEKYVEVLGHDKPAS